MQPQIIELVCTHLCTRLSEVKEEKQVESANKLDQHYRYVSDMNFKFERFFC